MEGDGHKEDMPVACSAGVNAPFASSAGDPACVICPECNNPLTLIKLLSAAIVGLEADLVSVEVDIVNGQPYFALVGLPDAAVRESKDRVCAAVKNSFLHFPRHRFPDLFLSLHDTLARYLYTEIVTV